MPANDAAVIPITVTAISSRAGGFSAAIVSVIPISASTSSSTRPSASATVSRTISSATVAMPRTASPAADFIARNPNPINPMAHSGGTAMATDWIVVRLVKPASSVIVAAHSATGNTTGRNARTARHSPPNPIPRANMTGDSNSPPAAIGRPSAMIRHSGTCCVATAMASQNGDHKVARHMPRWQTSAASRRSWSEASFFWIGASTANTPTISKAPIRWAATRKPPD